MCAPTHGARVRPRFSFLFSICLPFIWAIGNKKYIKRHYNDHLLSRWCHSYIEATLLCSYFEYVDDKPVLMWNKEWQITG